MKAAMARTIRSLAGLVLSLCVIISIEKQHSVSGWHPRPLRDLGWEKPISPLKDTPLNDSGPREAPISLLNSSSVQAHEGIHSADTLAGSPTLMGKWDAATPAHATESHIGLSGMSSLEQLSENAPGNTGLSGVQPRNVTPTIQIQDVSAACEAYHDAKRGRQLSPRLSELTTGDKERASQRLQAFIDNGCEDVDEVDECRNKGINVFDGTSVSCVDAVNAWYNQVHDYTYERYSNWHFKKTGSFTLLMWDDTEELCCVQTNGCRQLGKPERLLCAYSPAGNTVGEYPFSLDQWKSIIERDGLPQTTIIHTDNGDNNADYNKHFYLDTYYNQDYHYNYYVYDHNYDGASSPGGLYRCCFQLAKSYRTCERNTENVDSLSEERESVDPHITQHGIATAQPNQKAPACDVVIGGRQMSGTSGKSILAHNEKRVEGMSTPIRQLVRNIGAVSQAEAYRDTIERGGCLFQHSGVRQYGENLYKSSVHTTCKDAVALWYSEKKNYTQYAAINSFNYQNFGHFTQVMWANSSGLGCAYSSKCRTVVCNYYPPGNYIGQYPFSRAQYNSILERDG
ncbi:mucin family glycoprotein [Toxoplasma gondii]|uniref:Mucin family glycoprotein n=1 Tax=Toxoplasma gondii TaxID=5811 RepID=A0A7J6KAQ1_TOXGO|nr:mucin family glycoprotein [Toxoplasma gondii]